MMAHGSDPDMKDAVYCFCWMLNCPSILSRTDSDEFDLWIQRILNEPEGATESGWPEGARSRTPNRRPTGATMEPGAPAMPAGAEGGGGISSREAGLGRGVGYGDAHGDDAGGGVRRFGSPSLPARVRPRVGLVGLPSPPLRKNPLTSPTLFSIPLKMVL